jgi:hypothetical protein
MVLSVMRCEFMIRRTRPACPTLRLAPADDNKAMASGGSVRGTRTPIIEFMLMQSAMFRQQNASLRR